MPTFEMMHNLAVAAQDMIENPEQTADIQDRVNGLASNIPDMMTRLRVERMPVTAAAGLISAEVAIGMHLADQPTRDTNLSATEDYFRMTAGVDEAASALAHAKLQDPENPFHPLYNNYCNGTDAYRRYTIEHPGEALKKGKLPETIDGPESDGQFLGLLSGNAQYTTYPHLLRGMMTIALEQSELPPADGLADQLKSRMGTLQSAAALSIQLFTQLNAGKDRARERARQLKEDRFTPVPGWSDTLQEYIETGNVPPVALELAAAALKQPLEDHRRGGHCTGQAAFTLRPATNFVTPLELSSSSAVSDISPDTYFSNHGITLVDGAFSPSLYQLTQGIEAGRITVFADPYYRSAVEAIAAHARRSGVSVD